MFKSILVCMLSFSVLSVQAETAVSGSDDLSLLISKASNIETKDCNFFEKNSAGKKIRSQKQIPCVMSQRSSGFSAAYRRHVQAYPDTRGEIKYVFDINPLGRVSNVSVVNSSLTSSAPESTSEFEKRLQYIIAFAVFPEYEGDSWQGEWKVKFIPE